MSCCPCCYTPTIVPYYPVITHQQLTLPMGSPQTLIQQVPPMTDQTWHHGYTCCNCQQCCDFRDCCNCTGLCYDCNVANNSAPVFNSPMGPLYQYYERGCCRSCFAAPYSGASCMGSLFPCWLNTLTIINQPTNIPLVNRPMSPHIYNIQTPTTLPSSTHLLPIQANSIPVVKTGPNPLIPRIHPVQTPVLSSNQILSSPISRIIPKAPIINVPISSRRVPFTRTI